MDPRRIRRIHSLGPSLHCLYLSHTPVAFGHRLYNQARGGISPRSTARFTASTRSRAPSFAKMPERRTFTAISLTSSASAISRFVLPSDTRRRVSISLSEKVGEATLSPTLDDKVQVITRRPNFWKYNGSTSLQFSQSHFSANWHKGGEDNFAGNFYLTLNANYNNQRKFKWNNTFELQMGAQTAPSDNNRTFRPTANKIKYSTNIGYKAYKSLDYSLSVVMETQPLPNYYANTDELQSKFFSPMTLSVGPGLAYSFQWGKKKRFTGNLNVAFVAYHLKYVGKDELVTKHGLPEGKHASHTFGPSAQLNTTYKICNQVTWTSRIDWRSNYHYTRIDWYNQVNFTVTKLITAMLIVNPILDDSSPKYRNENGKYIMLNENLSIGLNYSF